jgi:hypothetical protein
MVKLRRVNRSCYRYTRSEQCSWKEKREMLRERVRFRAQGQRSFVPTRYLQSPTTQGDPGGKEKEKQSKTGKTLWGLR